MAKAMRRGGFTSSLAAVLLISGSTGGCGGTGKEVGPVLRAYVAPSRDTIAVEPETDLPWDRDRAASDTLPVLPVADTLPFDEFAAKEIARFEKRISPRRWLELHPDDQLTRFAIGEVDWSRWDEKPLRGRWCAHARRRIPVAEGGVAVRTALFYPPRMPVPPTLPPVRDTLGADLTGCRLGALWLEVGVSDSAVGRGLVREARVLISEEHGEAEPVIDFNTYRATGWVDAALWPAGESWIVAMYDPEWPSAGTVRVGRWNRSYGLDLGPIVPGAVARAVGLPVLREVVRIAELDSTRAEPLLSLIVRGYSHFRSLPSEPWSEETFFRELEPWMRDARELAPVQRAAALLLADRVMTWAVVDLESENGGKRNRARLETLGAEFRQIYDVHYLNSWLEEAYRLAPEGPIGGRVFEVFLPYGLETWAICGAGTELFRTVVEEGERFLSEGGDAVVEARVHLLVARAYADIVALAAETSSPANLYFQGEDYRDEAPSARREAVRHFEKALDALGSGPEGPTIWREAWRLASGLPPVETWFACTWD